jgi:hypothetical protein
MYTKRSFTFFYVRLTFPLPEILKPIGKIEPFASNQRASYPSQTGGDIWTCPHFDPSAHLGFELLQTSPDCRTERSVVNLCFAEERTNPE